MEEQVELIHIFQEENKQHYGNYQALSEQLEQESRAHGAKLRSLITAPPSISDELKSLLINHLGVYFQLLENFPNFKKHAIAFEKGKTHTLQAIDQLKAEFSNA